MRATSHSSQTIFDFPTPTASGRATHAANKPASQPAARPGFQTAFEHRLAHNNAASRDVASRCRSRELSHTSEKKHARQRRDRWLRPLNSSNDNNRADDEPSVIEASLRTTCARQIRRLACENIYTFAATALSSLVGRSAGSKSHPLCINSSCPLSSRPARLLFRFRFRFRFETRHSVVVITTTTGGLAEVGRVQSGITYLPSALAGRASSCAIAASTHAGQRPKSNRTGR